MKSIVEKYEESVLGLEQIINDCCIEIDSLDRNDPKRDELISVLDGYRSRLDKIFHYSGQIRSGSSGKETLGIITYYFDIYLNELGYSVNGFPINTSTAGREWSQELKDKLVLTKCHWKFEA